MIDCGVPPDGSKWELTQLAIGPLDAFAAPLVGVQAMALRTVGHFYTGNVAPTSYPGMIAPPAPIPNSLTLAPGEVEIGLTERLIVIVQNAPVGLVLLVDFEVKQLPLGDYSRGGQRHRWLRALLGSMG